MADRHVRRGAEDYADALAWLLPTGPAWPRAAESVLMRLVSGLAAIWGYVDSRAAELLERESDPRLTIEMLDDWERNFGLPDPCFAQGHTIAERQAILVEWMTLEGGQSRGFFVAMAARIGYAIRITEYAPYMCGISECGDTRDEWGDWRWMCGPEWIRFIWTVHVDSARLTWFRTGPGGGEPGVDHHLEIGIALDLECMLRRWKPAHTEIDFQASGMDPGDSMAGTP